MNFKNYKKYIVVDEDNRPMTFEVNQFCYCTNHQGRNPFPVNLYSYEEAMELIKKTIEYRTKNEFSIGTYNLMPVGPKLKFKKL